MTLPRGKTAIDAATVLAGTSGIDGIVFGNDYVDGANAAARSRKIIGSEVQNLVLGKSKQIGSGVGFSATAADQGTKSSGTFTPDPAGGNFQYAVNGGAHTLDPPTNNCTIVLHLTNNGSAGAVTTSGFTIVTGDAFTTTDTHEFICYITKVNDVSHLNVVALQ